MHVVKTRNMGLSTSYIATLAVMDGFGALRRTSATVVTVLAVLTLAPVGAATAQSAGDRQYSDPLVTDGGGQSGQQSPSSQGDGDTPTSAPATPAPAGGPDDTTSNVAGETAAESGATLPHTGAEPLALAAIGLALATAGGLALALPRRRRHARR
jgi:LPXTG-motif cell wall-anchored protein